MKKLLWIVLLLPFMLFAQESASALESILDMLKPLADAYLGKFGWAAQVVSIVGSLRLVFKPLMTLLDVYVKATPSKEDDNLVSEIEKKGWYKTLRFVLDWIASIKL